MIGIDSSCFLIWIILSSFSEDSSSHSGLSSSSDYITAYANSSLDILSVLGFELPYGNSSFSRPFISNWSIWRLLKIKSKFGSFLS
jgi:hypothetical protein